MKVGQRVTHKILVHSGTVTEIVDRYTVKVLFDGHQKDYPAATRVLQEDDDR